MRHTWSVRDAETVGNATTVGVHLTERVSVGLAERFAVAKRIAFSVADRIANRDPVTDADRHARGLAERRSFAERIGIRGSGRCGVRFAEPVPESVGQFVAEPEPVADGVTQPVAEPESVALGQPIAIAVAKPDRCADAQRGAERVGIPECVSIAVRFAARFAPSVPDPEPVRRGFSGHERIAGDRADPDAGRQLAQATKAGPQTPGNGHSTDPRETDRARMVKLQIASRGIRDPETLRALATVPRDRFVPHNLQDRAYEDGALRIGRGQTISQPYIVARSTAALGLGRWQSANPGIRPRVLDIGTGSGYQAAVLAEMGADVTSIEFDPQLAAAARERLAALGYAVEVIQGDGGDGHLPNAPYAAIVVAAAAPGVPPPLLSQLEQAGTLVIPIGDRHHQMLTAVRRAGDRIDQEPLEPVVFVPLLGRYGFR